MLTNKELANRLSASEAECARLNKWADGMTDAAMKERATAEAYQRELKAECAKLRQHAEAMHGWIDRVLSCVERAEQDIGGETMGAIILAGGPIYESFSEYLAALAAKGNGNG